MKLKSEYVQRIENRCYELLLRLRFQTELRGLRFSGLNLDFALRTFHRDFEVDLLEETDLELIFLSLIRNLINLVCLEEGEDVSLVLLDVYSAYLEYIDKADKV